MPFNSLFFAIFLPLVFGLCGLMAHTPQGYRGGVRPDLAPAAFGAFDQLDPFEIQTATSLSLLGFAAVAFCRRLAFDCRVEHGEHKDLYALYVLHGLNANGLSYLPCRGGEGGENARRGEAHQSANLDSGNGVGLLRRMGDAAMPETFYTFSTSTRLNKGGAVLPCRGGEGGENARLGEITQSPNLDSRRFGAGKAASQIGRRRIVADFLHVLPLYTAN
jgi:hypothetical protein